MGLGVGLYIDVGNTRIKWGVHDGVAWCERGACLTREAAQLGQPWASWSVQRAVVSSVAGPEIAAQLSLPDNTRHLQARAEAYGVTVCYARPEELGSDRYAALIAARALGLGPCLVVLAGTAVTIDFLTAKGQFQGGLIVPGRIAMAQALASATHSLTKASGFVTDWPDNTRDGLETGRLRAICGAIEAQWRRAQHEAGGAVSVVLSGGDAAWLAPELEPLVGTLRGVDDLVLEGLRVVAGLDDNLDKKGIG
jgi:type III pantothenate kinase